MTCEIREPRKYSVGTAKYLSLTTNLLLRYLRGQAISLRNAKEIYPNVSRITRTFPQALGKRRYFESRILRDWPWHSTDRDCRLVLFCPATSCMADDRVRYLPRKISDFDGFGSFAIPKVEWQGTVALRWLAAARWC